MAKKNALNTLLAITPKLIALHVLLPSAPGNRNRDKQGQPKVSDFAGVLRARESSQCRKSIMRNGPFFDGLREKQSMSTNTRTILNKISEDAIEDGADPVFAYAAALLLAPLFGKKKTCSKSAFEAAIKDGITYSQGGIEAFAHSDKGDVKKDGRTLSASIKVKQSEEACLVDALDKLVDGMADLKPAITALTSDTEETETEETEDKEEAYKSLLETVYNEKVAETFAQIQKDFATAQASPNVDIGLFGRMIASDTNMPAADGAIRFAHSIGVTEYVGDSDFFTATDAFDPNTGSAHNGFKTMTSTVFYDFVAIDLHQLMRTLYVEGTTDTGDVVDLTREAVAAVLQSMVKYQAGGQQTTMASLIPASYVLATVTDEQPTQYTDAFMQPVESSNVVEEAIERLERHHDLVVTRMNLEHRAVTTWAKTHDLEPLASGGEVAPDLNALVEKTLTSIFGKIEQEVAAAE